ncbi:hypothetical protein EON65_55400 [archaeon]|nr:MAG: hypothetical protein EON65_55400 [archaeon]
MENKEKAEMQTFLSEIEGIGGDDNPYDDAHVEISDLFDTSKNRVVDEDDILQLAYMAKFAHLLKQSDEVVEKNAQNNNRGAGAPDDSLVSIVQEAERITDEIVGVAGEDVKSMVEMAYVQAVSRMKRRKEEREGDLDDLLSKGVKRHKEDDDDNGEEGSDNSVGEVEYSPLDFF